MSSLFVNASFVEIEVSDISQEGIMHLAIYNSITPPTIPS